MGNAIESLQTGQVVGRRFVDESAVFAAHEEMVGQVDVRSNAVDERRPSLRARCGRVLRGEDQSTGAPQDERRPALHRHPENVCGGDFMRVANCVLNISFSFLFI
jgi:hypothetical protein